MKLALFGNTRVPQDSDDVLCSHYSGRWTVPGKSEAQPNLWLRYLNESITYSRWEEEWQWLLNIVNTSLRPRPSLFALTRLTWVFFPAPTCVTMPTRHDECKPKVHLFITVAKMAEVITPVWKWWCCFVCPLRDENAKDGVGGKKNKRTLQLPSKRANEYTEKELPNIQKYVLPLLGDMINPVHWEKILTLNRKVSDGHWFI